MMASWHGNHDDVIKWKHFPRNWPFVRGIHRSPVNSSHKGQWRRPLMLSLIWVWINGWVNTRDAGDLRCYRAHYDVTVMLSTFLALCEWKQTVTSQRGSKQSFDIILVVNLNKLWNRQSNSQRFRTVWCQCDVTAMNHDRFDCDKHKHTNREHVNIILASYHGELMTPATTTLRTNEIVLTH